MKQIDFTSKRIAWESPVSHYPEIKKGRVQIRKKRKSTRDCYYAEGVRGHLFLRYERGHNQIVVLSLDGTVWMTDDPQYVWSLESFAERARGKVLVAGLGLGIVLHQLVQNKEVSDILVVERDPDVIAVVGKLVPDDGRIKIWEEDFYEFVRADKHHRDTVIWDLAVWSGDGKCSTGLAEMLMMPAIVERCYGNGCKLFRHGFDRDPVGERFVAEHGDDILKIKRVLGGLS